MFILPRNNEYFNSWDELLVWAKSKDDSTKGNNETHNFYFHKTMNSYDVVFCSLCGKKYSFSSTCCERPTFSSFTNSDSKNFNEHRGDKLH